MLLVVQISCREVWREISNFVDGEIEAELRQRLAAHFRNCKHCSALLDGTRNVVRLAGDGEFFDLPEGFQKRLEDRIADWIRERC